MASKLVTLQQFKKRILTLIKHPFFWVLTITGNTAIFVGSLLLYWFENSEQVQISFMDCLLWAAGLVTTVGYGDFTPQSTLAKVVVLLLMLSGTLFIWLYMAFLVSGIMAPEISSLERDVHDVEKEIRGLKKGSDGQAT